MRIALAERAQPTLPAEEDALLVDRFRAGERTAFDELVRRYQRPIYYLARRYVKDDDDAKDVAQRAFVRAFQGIGQLRGGGAFRTWLYRIVCNLAINHVRDHARTVAGDESADVPIEAIGSGRLVETESRRELLAAIEALPPRQRQVLELRVFEEMSFREVADIAGCTENAAKVNFHHAVKRLRAFMVEGEDGD